MKPSVYTVLAEIVEGEGFIDFAPDAGFVEYLVLLLCVGAVLAVVMLLKKRKKDKGDAQ